MFAKFFTPFTSKESNYKSNISVISAANYLVNSICGTIYHNATSYIHSKITNKVLNPKPNELTPTESNPQKILQAPPELTTPAAAETPPEEPNDNTNQDEVLKELFFSEPSANKRFPEDYACELHEFHQIVPEIRFSNPYKNDHSLAKYNLMQELANSITSLSQLEEMRKKWLCFQEELWGKDFDLQYLVTGIEEENDIITPPPLKELTTSTKKLRGFCCLT